jgi:hypothetical protein
MMEFFPEYADQITDPRKKGISLQAYSQNVSTGAPQSGKMGRYFRDIGYGYQWWSARVGDHQSGG